MTAAIAVNIRNLEVTFGSGETANCVFHGFSADMSLPAGKVTVLGGGNGVGKSVLARALADPARHVAEITLSDSNGDRIPPGHVFYMPQNLEVGRDRLAIDLFSSVASIGHRIKPQSLMSGLRALGLSRRDLYSPCDNISRHGLIRGVLLSSRRSRARLIILDEPLAQVTSTERSVLDSEMTDFARESGTPILVIAHPDQRPTADGYYLLESSGPSSKSIRKAAAVPTRRSRTASTRGSPSFSLQWDSKDNSERYDLRLGEVNQLVSPSGVPAGGFASILVRAFRNRGLYRNTRRSLEMRLTPTGVPHWPRAIKYFPPGAQTSVVPSSMRVAEAMLYDRWEEAPRTPIRGILEREALKTLFAEAGYFLPIFPELDSYRGRQLSGGNRQILALRTVAYPLPDLLVAALVYSGLDDRNAARVDSFLRYAAASGTTVITIDSGA